MCAHFTKNERSEAMNKYYKIWKKNTNLLSHIMKIEGYIENFIHFIHCTDFLMHSAYICCAIFTKTTAKPSKKSLGLLHFTKTAGF